MRNHLITSGRDARPILSDDEAMGTSIMTDVGAPFRGINLACGGKLCREAGWINADHNPSAKDVMHVNLLKPLPFADDSFDVVYHSQFIEHLPGDRAMAFVRECRRILKPGGILRVVTPDLQNQAAEYLRNLQDLLKSPDDAEIRLRYEWIRHEMLDQLTRHQPGGEMVTFLDRSGRQVRPYLWQRMGRSGHNLVPPEAVESASWKTFLRVMRSLARACVGRMTPVALSVGRFRLSGESHLCMYDEYLLARLLHEAGFVQIGKVGAKESRIPQWNRTLLDCDEQGHPDGEVSLFMEAVKPA